MKHSWDDLDQYRGVLFQGQWPTIIDLLLITEQKFGTRNSFTVFRPDRVTLTYTELLNHVKRVGSYLMEQGFKKGDVSSSMERTVHQGHSVSGNIVRRSCGGTTGQSAAHRQG
jgi:hypothetical protein